MHRTLEGVQQSATPAIGGPLAVAVALSALVATLLAPSRLGQVVVGAVFLALTVDAVGLRPLRWLGVPVAFLVPSLAGVLVSVPGTALLGLGPIAVTDAGLHTAIDTGVRSLASLSVLSFLVGTTPVSTVVLTLRRAGLPAVLIELFLYVYRAIATLLSEAQRSYRAATLRGGFRSRRVALRTTKLVSAALFVRAIDRVSQLEESMRARCYAGEPPASAAAESKGHAVAVGILALLVGVQFL
jgi:cobalt/nickel transport system permease protein